MKKLLAGVACAALLLACRLTATSDAPRDLVGKTFQARVVRVIDGDTIDVLKSDVKAPIRVRLDGIDTPENGEAFSKQAKNLTRVLAFDQQVTVVGKDVDRYKRLVARVLSGGKDLSVSLVEAGLACHFLKYSADNVLATAESAAKFAGMGFWASGSPKPRCVGLSQRPLPASSLLAEGFWGNSSSRVYHSEACKNAHCKNCTQRFTTVEDAERAGYRAARDCFPKGRR